MSTSTNTTSDTVSTKPFETLTSKQQAIIDELARERVDGLDRTNAELVADCIERHDVEEFHPTFVYKVRDTYPELIEERENVLLNGHDRKEAGNVSIEGSIDLTDEKAHPKPQTWDERPVKQAPPEAGDDGETVTLEVTQEVLFGIIEGSLPREERRAIFEAVVE